MAIFTGGAGRNTLTGGAEADTLSGGEGRDVLRGGAGDDVIYGHGASDETPGSGAILARRVGAGFEQPVFVTSAPGDADRLFVVEKTGAIKILDPATGAVVSTFLDIPNGEISDDGEGGLLGLAFHPDYATNGKFFVYVTNAAGDIELRAYSRSNTDPNAADPASGDVILTIPHPTYSNHNGGWIAFGPDGYLYIATGDGGGGGDPNGNAQNKNSLLGKMLRIDVNSDGFVGDDTRDYAIPTGNPFADTIPGADEIWAYGLRNPWRNSFDRLTGDLYIGDVGQNAREEVNYQPGGASGGQNYGWKIREGKIPYAGGALPPDLVDPLLDYAHSGAPSGGSSITGGYVYRGTAPGMQGVYFYADFTSDQIWSFRVVGGQVVDAANRTAQLVQQGGSVDGIVSFGEDGHGNLYIVGIDGEIFRLDPQEGAGDGADWIEGGAGRDRIWGGVGHDTLYGGADADRLYGNGQNDILIGGAGRDLLTGGSGADRFVFTRLSDSGAGARDWILDLRQGDRIDLRSLDARAGESGNQAFRFIGKAAFTGEGQIRAEQHGADVLLLINSRSGGGAEMKLWLDTLRLSSLSAGDFLL